MKHQISAGRGLRGYSSPAFLSNTQGSRVSGQLRRNTASSTQTPMKANPGFSSFHRCYCAACFDFFFNTGGYLFKIHTEYRKYSFHMF